MTNWLLDQITGGYAKTCTSDVRELGGIAATGSQVTVNDAGIIKTGGYFQADVTVQKDIALDVSGLAEGNYLLLITDEKGRTETHMFSKK